MEGPAAPNSGVTANGTGALPNFNPRKRRRVNNDDEGQLASSTVQAGPNSTNALGPLRLLPPQTPRESVEAGGGEEHEGMDATASME